MKEISIKKGDILQRKGDLNSKIYNVKTGLLRSYTIDEQGKEHIYMFAPEDWIMSDNTLDNEPCDLFIDALEDSELEMRNKDFTDADVNTDKILRRMGVLQKRVIMLMSSSAIERYDHFVERYPQIVQRVPQKMIASYLGITPEALSRVKKERFRK